MVSQIAQRSGDRLPVIARVLYTLATLVIAAIGVAQTTPPPPEQDAPLGEFIGRYLDSAQTQSLQCPIRTYRAYDVKASSEDNLLYFAIGSAFVGQDPATFSNRLATEALARGFRGEKYLAFDHWYRREQCSYDAQVSILGFDWDDRGYKYVSYAWDGLVILDEDFQEVNRVDNQLGTEHLAFRNGTSYYLLIALDYVYPGGAHLLNVTDPTGVQHIRDVTSIAAMAKSRDNRIAIFNNDRVLRIYTTDAVVGNSAPLYTFTPPTQSFVLDMTSDGKRFYALVSTNGNVGLHVFTPSGDTYTQSVAASNLNASRMRYGAGYVVVYGSTGAKFFEVGDDGLTPAGAEPLSWYYEPTEYRDLRAVQPVVAGDQTVAVVSANGVGDVFALDALDPLTISQSFLPESINVGENSHFSVTITNPRATPVMFGMAHTYASGLSYADNSIPATTCGTVVIASGNGSFVLSKARLEANASCTVTAILTSATPGTYVSTIPAAAIVSPENTNAVESSATLLVLAPAGPPPSLSATATSSTSVALTWAQVTGSPTYEIFRNDVLIDSTTNSTYIDTTVSANTSYLYKVRTVGTSGFSPPDVATTVIFTDASLTGVVAKAIHIAELRTAVSAMRTLATLGATTFTDAPLHAGTTMKAVHITELRTALDEARAALGLSALTHGALSTVRAVDITELRAGTQ